VKPRTLLAGVLVLAVATTAWLMIARRMPRGHDGFLQYVVQHGTLSNAAAGGGAPLWSPYMAQGSATNMPLSWQASFPQCLYMAIGPMLRGLNFQPLYLLSMLFQEVVLVLGLWLLSRRFLTTPLAQAFVAATALGSCIWADQVWHNFQAFYSLPLVIELLHRFIDRHSRGSLFLAGNLFTLQVLGGLPYAPILSAIVLTIWFASHAAIRHDPSLRAIRPRLLDLPVVGGVLVTVALVGLLLLHDSRELVLLTPGRDASGTTSVTDFLTFAGHLNPVKYLDLLVGLSPSIDGTLFCGHLTLAFAALAVVARPDRRTLHLVVVALLLLLLATGLLGLIALFVYYFFPGATYYRHLGLISPTAKLVLILLAGVGVDRAAREMPGRRLAAAALVVVGAALAGLALGPDRWRTTLGWILLTSWHGADDAPLVTDAGQTAMLVGVAALGAIGAGVVLLVKPSQRTVLAAVAFHVLHLFAWKVATLQLKTLPMTSDQAALQVLEPAPYLPRRTIDYESSARFRILKEPLFAHMAHGRFFSHGEMYWHTDTYLGLDPPSSRFRTNEWSRSIDDLMRAYTHQPLGDPGRITCWQEYVLRFPLDHPSGPKLVGLSQDKIQFFHEAHSVATAADAAALIADPRYAGDMLFLVGGSGKPWKGGSLNDSERVETAHTVAEFDANHITIEVTSPAGAWLSYADAWHPSWRATVNGAPVAVERANLGYKAVKIPAGRSTVEFRFHSPVRAWCFRFLSLNAIVWIAGVLWMLGRELRGPPSTAPPA